MVNTRAEKSTDIRLASRCAATASAGAALIHLAAAPMHWGHWVLSALFFVAVAVFQAGWAYLAWTRPTTAVLGAGIAVNLAVAVLWVVSRTDGVPFGPNAGRPEAVEGAGICALLLECYVVMGAGWALIRASQAEQVSGVRTALVLLGANGVVAVAVALGLTSALHGHHHHGVTEAQPGVSPPAVEPVPDRGLPVTDMGLETDGHDHRHESPYSQTP